jgi:hypothetical protein
MVTKSLTRVLQVAGIAATVSLTSLAVAPKAQAALLFTDSAFFENEVTDLDPSDPSLTLTLSKFNPIGKTVNKVVVSLEKAEIVSSGSITNTSRNPRTFTVETKLNQFTISPNAGAPAALSAFNPFSASPATPVTLASQTFTNLARNATANFGPFTNTTSSEQIFETASDISQFLGVGTFSFSPFTDIDTIITSLGGNNINNIDTSASVRVTVAYYGIEDPQTPPRLPEASTTLGILGLAGAAFVSKKLSSLQKLVG